MNNNDNNFEWTKEPIEQHLNMKYKFGNTGFMMACELHLQLFRKLFKKCLKTINIKL